LEPGGEQSHVDKEDRDGSDTSRLARAILDLPNESSFGGLYVERPWSAIQSELMARIDALRRLTKQAAMREMQTSSKRRRPIESMRNQGMNEARKNH